MSSRTIGRIVGFCFLLAFVFYSGGWSIVDAGSGTPASLARVVDHKTQITAGALLMMLNSRAITAALGGWGVYNIQRVYLDFLDAFEVHHPAPRPVAPPV